VVEERAGGGVLKRAESRKNRGKLRNNVKIFHNRNRDKGSRECHVREAEGLDPRRPLFS